MILTNPKGGPLPPIRSINIVFDGAIAWITFEDGAILEITDKAAIVTTEKVGSG